MRHTRLIPFPGHVATTDEPTPGPDGLYRDCVIRAPHLDEYGRKIYVAVDERGWKIDSSVAVSDEESQRVRTRLWRLVLERRIRAPLEPL